MKRFYSIMLLVVLTLTTIDIANAAVIGKHPRVAELEDKIAKDASAFIQSRFPTMPFLVRVEIDPVMRAGRLAGKNGQEKLPFFELEGEEIRDEWDNPEVPLLALMARIKKAMIVISLPDNVTDVEITELRESLFSLLHFTQARDEVQILRKAWELKKMDWSLFALVIGGLLLFLFSTFIINRLSVGRIARALKESGSAKQTSLPFSGAAAAGSAGAAGTGAKSDLQEIHFNDQIKVKELLADIISHLNKFSSFPVLFDMLELDKLGKKDHSKLGVILNEFPETTQLRLYAYSFNTWWLDSLSDPGNLDYSCVELLQRLKQYPRENLRIDWEQLLISVWRLDDLMLPYLKSIDKGEAFSILAALPKSVSVPKAKLAFPGAWAPILEWNYNIQIPSKDRIVELMKKAIQLKPLNDSSTLKRYKIERDLLEFLKVADFQDERDIYEAASNESKIQMVRPPFYKIFEIEDEDLKKISELVTLDDWALALHEVPSNLQKKVLQFLTDKQRFVVYEKIKNINLAHTTKEHVGTAREKIARQVRDYFEVKEFNAQMASLEVIDEKDILSAQEDKKEDA